MIRTQIYLTEEEQKELRRIADLEGASQSELIRQAIDRFIAGHRRSSRLEMLRAARGIWAERTDFDWRGLRLEFERALGEPANG